MISLNVNAAICYIIILNNMPHYRKKYCDHPSCLTILVELVVIGESSYNNTKLIYQSNTLNVLLPRTVIIIYSFHVWIRLKVIEKILLSNLAEYTGCFFLPAMLLNNYGSYNLYSKNL